MKKELPGPHDPCPFCGRPLHRPSIERLVEPFCSVCISERIKASGKVKKPQTKAIMTNGYS